MMQISATFSDDFELEKLRDFAAHCGLCQIGRVTRKPFYRRVKFQSICDDGRKLTNETEKQSKE